MIINTIVKILNPNEPIVKACSDANWTTTKKGPRGTNNNLIINNVNVSLRKLRLKSRIGNVSLRKLLKKQKGGDRLGRETAVDRGDPTTASPGGHHFQENFRIINVSFYLYKPFHSHGEHAFWICYHQEVDSAIAGFEPGSQPPRSAAEILLATLAQVLPFFVRNILIFHCDLDFGILILWQKSGPSADSSCEQKS